MPSTPMKEERLSTAGSLRITSRQFLLALGHGGKGDRLGRLGDPLDHAGVLDREEPFGHDDVEQHRQDQGADRHQQGGGLVAQHPLQRPCRRRR